MGDLREKEQGFRREARADRDPKKCAGRQGSHEGGQPSDGLDLRLRAYSDSDICPMHMPGHKRKTIDEIEDMLKREAAGGECEAESDGLEAAPEENCRDWGDWHPSHARGACFPPENGTTGSIIPPEHLDITEIDGFDNLHRTSGILRDLEADLADLYRVPAAKISVGGSTVGLLAAITAVTAPGDRVLIARNCHAAVYHAALVQGLAVDYLLPEADGSIAPAAVSDAFENNALARMIREMAEGKLPGFRAAEVMAGKRSAGQSVGSSEEKMRKPVPVEASEPKHSGTESYGNRKQSSGGRSPAGSLTDDTVMTAAPYKAVILTCPTYEGIMSDIAAIAKIVHSYGAVLIVDAAHGAHLWLSDEPIFPENPVHCGADIVIVSLHKTLPALTMTGAILIAPPAAIREQADTDQAPSVGSHGHSGGNRGQAAEERTLPERSCGQATEERTLSEGIYGQEVAGHAPSVENRGQMAARYSQSVEERASALASALDIYESSSPSYILLASIARMVRFLREHGEEAFHQYAKKLAAFYRAAEGLADPAVLGSGDDSYAPGRRVVTVDGRPQAVVTDSTEDSAGRNDKKYSGNDVGPNGKEFSKYQSYIRKDPSKIVIMSKKDIINRLRTNYHIELEMASLSYALAMTSLADSQESFDRLLAALRDMNAKGQQESDTPAEAGALAQADAACFTLDLPFAAEDYKLPQRVCSIRDAYFAPSEAAAAGAAAGRISAAFVSVFPPEIPVLVPGERIGEPELALLESAAERGFTIHGLIDGKIRVVK